jgi:hypothetical protein
VKRGSILETRMKQGRWVTVDLVKWQSLVAGHQPTAQDRQDAETCRRADEKTRRRGDEKKGNLVPQTACSKIVRGRRCSSAQELKRLRVDLHPAGP